MGRTDGWCDGQDAYLATLYANGWLHDDTAEYAADVNHDGYINERDFETMQKAGLLLKEIDQNKTEQELSEDSSYIEYTSLISQTVPVNPDMSLLQVINEFIAKIIEFINCLAGSLLIAYRNGYPGTETIVKYLKIGHGMYSC